METCSNLAAAFSTFAASDTAPAWAQAILSVLAIVFSGLFAGQAVLRQYRLDQSRKLWTLHGLVRQARRFTSDFAADVRAARKSGAMDQAHERFERLSSVLAGIGADDYGNSDAVAPILRTTEIMADLENIGANSYLPQSKGSRLGLLESLAALRREEKILLQLAKDAHLVSRRFWLV